MTITLMSVLGLLTRFASIARADEPLLAVGAAAPEVVGADAKGTTFKLSAQKGKYAIVYFYPKDDTPGCTKEACAFRDAFDKFVAAGVTIFGVSRDAEPSHKAFMQKYTLPFPLVADPSGVVAKAYHVPSTFGYDKRVSFLVAPDGKIVKVYPDVDPGVHAKELLDTISALRAAHK
ncbi:MAG TPA: peroxiredoxin [Polyangia bacterium]|jgi:peroxiredoxin Q/BCP